MMRINRKRDCEKEISKKERRNGRKKICHARSKKRLLSSAAAILLAIAMVFSSSSFQGVQASSSTASQTAYVALSKSYTAVTNITSYPSVTGAFYGLYSSSDCSGDPICYFIVVDDNKDGSGTGYVATTDSSEASDTSVSVVYGGTAYYPTSSTYKEVTASTYVSWYDYYYSTYYFKELIAPYGYLLDTDVSTVTAQGYSSVETSELSAADTVAGEVSFSLSATDSSGNTLSSYNLSGAVYQVYTDDEIWGYFITNSNGTGYELSTDSNLLAEGGATVVIGGTTYYQTSNTTVSVKMGEEYNVSQIIAASDSSLPFDTSVYDGGFNVSKGTTVSSEEISATVVVSDNSYTLSVAKTGGTYQKICGYDPTSGVRTETCTAGTDLDNLDGALFGVSLSSGSDVYFAYFITTSDGTGYVATTDSSKAAYDAVTVTYDGVTYYQTSADSLSLSNNDGESVTVYVTELVAPDAYNLNSTAGSATFSSSSTENTVTITDSLKTSTVYLQKIGVHADGTEISSYDYLNVVDDNVSLAGALYAVYDSSGEVYCYFVTDSDGTGYLTLDGGSTVITSYQYLPYGTYTVKEIQAASGYSLNKEVYTIVIDEKTETIEVEDVLEDDYVSFGIVKLYNTDTYGETEYSDDTSILFTVTDEDGDTVAQFVITASSSTFGGNAGNTSTNLTYYNDLGYENEVGGYLVDSLSTSTSSYYSGTKYVYYYSDDTFDEYYAGVAFYSSMYTTAERTNMQVNLEYGTYTITEQLCDNYSGSYSASDGTTYTITVDENSPYEYIFVITNYPDDTGFLTLQKTAQDADGNELDITEDEYNISGALYGIYDSGGDVTGYLITDSSGVGYTATTDQDEASEDMDISVTYNGTTYYITDEEAFSFSTAGTYTVKELVAPEGFTKAEDEEVTITLGSVTNLDSVDVYGEEATTALSLSKTGLGTGASEVDTGTYSLAGALYQVYNEDSDVIGYFITSSDGTGYVASTSSSDALSGGVSVTYNGTTYYQTSSTSIDVADGTYYAKELAAPSGFNVSSTVFEITTDADEDEEAEVEVTDYVTGCALQLEKTGVDGSGSSLDSAYTDKFSLAGAVYTVYDSNGTTVGYFTIGSDGKGVATYVFSSASDAAAFYDALSDKSDYTYTSGSSEVSTTSTSMYVSAGTYTIKETTAPTSGGYQTDTSTYSVTITGSDTAKTQTVSDTAKYASMTLTKTDSSTGEKVGPATYALYSYVNGVETHIQDIEIGEDGTSSALDYGLEAGTYHLKETKAPDGYFLDSSTHEFTITSSDLGTVVNIGVNDSDTYVLASTGGSGVYALIFASIFILAAGTALLLVLRRRSRKAAN